MKNLQLFLCLTILLWGGQALAAPYDLDSDPASYTWGETQEAVRAIMPDAQRLDSRVLQLPPESGGYMRIFNFWQDKLAGIVYVSATINTREEAQASYNQLYEVLNKQWGQPSAPAPSSGNDGTMQIWKASPATSIRLYLIERNEQKYYVNYAYISNQLFPGYERESKELGDYAKLELILNQFNSNQAQAWLGKRVRIAGKILEVLPLRISQNSTVAICKMENNDDLTGLRPGDEIIVSATVEGVAGEWVVLKDVKMVERPDRLAGTGHPGHTGRYFNVDDFLNILVVAAKRVTGDDNITRMLGKPYMDSSDRMNDRLVVWLTPPGYTQGISFSLEHVHDLASDTLAVNIPMTDGGRFSGEFVMACMYMVLYASQPEMNVDEEFVRIEDAMKTGKPININGWTYEGTLLDKSIFTFSATAPGM